MDCSDIIAGLGVIVNDFQDRKDLTPNVCVFYVDKAYRNRGIAGSIFQFACDDMNNNGVSTLYLLTDHNGFYEKYGWDYLCMALGDGEEQMSRMYIYKNDR